MTTIPTPPTETAEVSLPSARIYPSLRAAWVPLLALALAFFVEMVDNTILTIALPTIGRSFDAGTTALQWVTGAYALTFGGLLLTAGALADRFGRRRLLSYGLAAFGAISALVPLVSSIGDLVALRAALGVAAAAVAPVTMSLVFRLFDDEALRMRAITLMVVVGMSGFALGPVLAGGVLAHVSWHWLLLVNVPIAAIAWVGVRRGLDADRPEDLHPAPLDLPGAAAVMAALGLFSYALTSGVEQGWTAPSTLACVVGAVVAVIAFIGREASAEHPMLDLTLLRGRTIRGAALAQLSGSVAMVGAMFGLVLHFQYAFGWSPVRAGLANLPFIVTMLVATPIAEWAAARFGHRIATMAGAVTLTASLVGLAVAATHGYLAIAAAMVGMTLGLRVIMTICAIALVNAMPANRTSIGAALNDTAQEIGTSLGIAVIGTVLAAAMGAALPAGVWSTALASQFFQGERAAYLVLAVLAGVISLYGASTLTDSRDTEEAARA